MGYSDRIGVALNLTVLPESYWTSSDIVISPLVMLHAPLGRPLH